MARSSAVDPLEKFRFIISWSNTNSEGTKLVRAGFHDVQMPKRTTNKIMYREGNDQDISSVSAGLSTMEDIVLSRGLIASDANNEMYNWMSSVHLPGTGITGYTDGNKTRPVGEASANYRKTVTIQMMDRTGAVVRQWEVSNAFPVHFAPGSDLNAAEDGEKSLESLTLAYEDFKETQPGA